MEDNGKGIFYGVIGVATLIVAIIGATFAFFTATANNATAVAGNTATVGLTLDVQKVSDDTANGLIPQLERGLFGTKGAIVGTEGKSCIDANNNSVCQVYKVTTSTTGSSALVLNATLELTTELTNLRWAIVSDGEGTNPAIVGSSHPKGDTTFETNVTLTNAANHITYVVIWLEEKAEANVGEVGTPFTGLISYQAGDGTGVTSTFTGA